MIKMLEEFKVKNCDFIFRYTTIKPTLLLSMATQLAFDSLKKNQEIYDLILKHTEVKVEGTWNKLVDVEGDFYPPVLELRLDVISQIVTKYLNEYLEPSFRNVVE